MRENLHRFFRAARGAGVRVSPAESIDAMRAVSKIGFNDRQILRDELKEMLGPREIPHTVSPGLWTLAWRRLKSDYVGMVSLWIVALFIVMMVLSAISGSTSNSRCRMARYRPMKSRWFLRT